jgi:DNA mismatch repair ATPase MutS
MDIVLTISAALSAIFTLVIVLLVFQIQKSLNTNEKQMEKLLRVVVEQAHELTKHQIEASSSLNKLLDNFIQEFHKIENYLNDLQKTNVQGNLNLSNLIQETQKIGGYLNQLRESNHQEDERLYNLLYGNTNMQLEKLQATVDELRALKASLEESVKF